MKHKLDDYAKSHIKDYSNISIRKYHKLPTRKLKQFWRDIEWASYVDTIKQGW